MGRYITKSNTWAYIAGFLDGDGSIMAQLKNRRDTKNGWRVMLTVCFYQDSRNKQPLRWIRKMIGIGYLTDRNDKITELRINGYRRVEQLLKNIKPFIRFKSKQVRLVLEMMGKIKDRRICDIAKHERVRIGKLMIRLRNENYNSSNRKYSDKELLKILKTFS